MVDVLELDNDGLGDFIRRYDEDLIFLELIEDDEVGDDDSTLSIVNLFSYELELGILLHSV